MKYSESFKEWKCTLGMIATVVILVSFIMKYAIDKNMERSGYCFEKEKYLSEIYTDQELIDRAIKENLSVLNSFLTLPEERENNVALKEYENIEEFKKRNPDCCTLTRSGPDGLVEEVFIYVELNYWIYSRHANQYKKIREYIPYNSCGEYPDFD
ncbi:hypothetical protein A1D29_03490 [Pasteurellaceae bacterium Orientalotternb1]|nr:hypothetical protein A1D29_03490 [Pasteurellaceae bacterium Orientalotternb1]